MLYAIRYARSPFSRLKDSAVMPAFLSVPAMKPRTVCFLCRCRHKNHSIRGFISGTLTKKMDLPVASLKNEAGDRVYRIEA